MIKFLHKLFNQDKIEEMERALSVYQERNEQLEKELKEYKAYKLKYEVTKLYVEDDDALLELFEAAQKRDAWLAERQRGGLADTRLQALQARQSNLAGLHGAQRGKLQGLLGSSW